MVKLNHVAVYPRTSERDAIAHPDAATTLALTEYRAQVLPFAEALRAFFLAAGTKTLDDDFDRDQHVEFWRAFDDILDRQLRSRTR